MKKKNTTDLRARADEALAALQSAEAAEQAAVVALNAIRGAPRSSSRRTAEEMLAENLADQKYRRAEQTARVARIQAAAALDAAEAAEGDLARAIDPVSMRDDLTAFCDDLARLRVEVQQAEQRRDERIAVARAARSALESRRRAAQLPPPLPLPSASVPMGTPSHLAGEMVARALIEAMDRRANGELLPSSRPNETLAALEREERALRLDIARHAREEAERTKERERDRKYREQQASEQAQRAQAERDEWAAKVEAQRREEEELLAEQRAAEAPGVPA